MPPLPLFARARSLPHPPHPTPITPAAPLSKPAEHMPDQYLSVHDLPRKLAADAKAADEASLAKLQKAVETLAAKAAAGSIDDLGKRKLETGKKLLKGAKGSEKLQERKKFKLSAGDATGQRLSSSIMFHPSCVRAALKG